MITRYYGIMPWDIGRLTLFQWQVYSEKIEVIYKIFHAAPKPGKGGKGSSRSPSAQNKDDHEELKRLARRKGIYKGL